MMGISECEQLDDYLAGWLSEDETASFETHLSGCSTCRRECERQRQIDHLLGQGIRQLEPVPSLLIDRIEQRVWKSHRRQVLGLACGMSAAAVVVLGLAVWLATGQFGTRGSPQPVVQNQTDPGVGIHQAGPPTREVSQAKPVVRVSFDDPSKAILIPLETEAPNVSIVWIYPTVKRAPASNGSAND